MLDTVGDYVTEARVLLQDQTAPERHPSTEIKKALGLGIYEMRRMRPDLFVFSTMPEINGATADGTAVAVEAQFRNALLHFIVGQVGLKDDEEGAESRASGFMASSLRKLLSVAG